MKRAIGDRMVHAWNGPGRYLGECSYGSERCTIVLASYAESTSPAILLQSERTGEAWGKLSVALEEGLGDAERLGDGEFVVHHDVEPADRAGVLATCGGAFEDTGRRVDYGWVVGQPVWRLGPAVAGALLAAAEQPGIKAPW